MEARNIIQPLNGPLEIGLRTVVVLSAWHPSTLDLDTLTLLDHALVHSADVGGPPSLHPALPTRLGELGLKRELLSQGLEVAIRAGLVRRVIGARGIHHEATEEARPFLDILESEQMHRLRDSSEWLVSRFGAAGPDAIRRELDAAIGSYLGEMRSPGRGPNS